MEAGAHLWRFLRLSGASVRVIFHAPITVPLGSNRKALSAQLHAVVASGLSPIAKNLPAGGPAAD